MSENNEYIVLGMMSGTSLDGLDMALCRFYKQGDQWRFHLLNAETVAYPDEWSQKLSHAHKLHARELLQLHNEYGRYTGQLAARFLKMQAYKPLLIASHGHTIFHRPDRQFTFQLGQGASIAHEAQCTTVCDFRVMDVAQGGEGAPLVPFGDMNLFNDYEACVNLGGFANITLLKKPPVAFDICPVNIVINKIAREAGHAFDENGGMARQGKSDHLLLAGLNKLAYYRMPPPKSLGAEWLTENIIPLLNASNIERHDRLRTMYEHIAMQIANVLNASALRNALVTGGGVKNVFLMELISEKTTVNLSVPSSSVIDFKEAVIFGFLGLMRMFGKHNVYASVTGGKQDISSGTIYQYPASSFPETQ